MKLLKKYFDFFENKNYPIHYYLLTICFVIILRNFIEKILIGTMMDASSFMHFTLFYCSIIPALILFFHFAAKIDIKKSLKFVSTCFFIIIFPPIIDKFLFFKQQTHIAYVLPEHATTFQEAFIQNFFTFPKFGVSPGMKIELYIILIMSFIYILYKSKSIKKTIISFLFQILLFFKYYSIPFLLNKLCNFFNINFIFSNEVIIKFYFIETIILLLITSYIYDKKLISKIIKDMRFYRLFFFFILFTFGLLYHFSFAKLNVLFTTDRTFETILNLIIVFISITGAWIFSVMTNNITDEKIDKISNKNRPLNSSINKKKYEQISYVILIISLISGLLISMDLFLGIASFIGIYYLYSMPPWRLKRVPIISKFLVASNLLIFFYLGMIFSVKFVSFQNISSLSSTILFEFPKNILFFFLIPFSLCLNFIDIKDYEGDKKEGIKTLPTLIGLKQSKLLIGLFIMFTNTSLYFIFDFLNLWYHFTFLLLMGIIQFFIINRKNYKDKYVMIGQTIIVIMIIMFSIIS